MNQLFTLYPLYKVQYSHGALRGNHTSLRAEHQHSRTNTKHCTCQLKTSKPPIDNTTQEPVACSQIVAMNSSEWPPKPFSAEFTLFSDLEHQKIPEIILRGGPSKPQFGVDPINPILCTVGKIFHWWSPDISHVNFQFHVHPCPKKGSGNHPQHPTRRRKVPNSYPKDWLGNATFGIAVFLEIVSDYNC